MTALSPSKLLRCWKTSRDMIVSSIFNNKKKSQLTLIQHRRQIIIKLQCIKSLFKILQTVPLRILTKPSHIKNYIHQFHERTSSIKSIAVPRSQVNSTSSQSVSKAVRCKSTICSKSSAERSQARAKSPVQNPTLRR